MKDKLGELGLLSDDNRPIAKFKANGVAYNGINNSGKRLLMYAIDGVMIAEGQKKCDHALALNTENVIYFIELKGNDLKEAAKQIYETISFLGNKLEDVTMHGRAVCSRIQTPDIRTTSVVALERALLKRKGNFQYKSRVFEEFI